VQSLIERSEEKPVVTKNVPCSWLRNWKSNDINFHVLYPAVYLGLLRNILGMYITLMEPLS
jgi:hypothetical protein